ncbi:MAG: hypothetical protein ABFD86_24410, partial [Bryobacteraceae bacterium]
MSELRNYRGIPQPVSDLFVTVQSRPPLRQTRMIDYVKTDRRYLIELRFHSDVDLALFEKFIENTSIRLVEYGPDHEGNSRLFLTDRRIDEQGGEDAIWKWVDEELPRIGAAIAVQFPEFVLPQCRCIVDLQSVGGRIDVITPLFKTKVIGRVDLPPLYALLKDTSGTLLTPFLDKCEIDADFREAVMYCGQALRIDAENPWAALYRTYEVVADRFGNDNELTSVLNFCSKNELDRVKRTLNHQEAIGAFSRHARLNYQPPPNPMSFEEARDFALGLVRSWH